MPTARRVNALLLAPLLLLGLGAASTAAAQPADGYIGPETTDEPQPGGQAKSGRHGSWGPGGGWSGDWAFCADEGQRCTVRGWGVVRFGTRGRYVYREVRNARFHCDNRQFGDPTPGRVKRCEVRLFDQGGWGGGGSGDRGWRFCAREDETCRVDGPATVRFGIDGRYYERPVRGGNVFCSIRTFGDPAPRQRKVCEVRYDGGRPGGGWSGGGWGDGGRWVECAREGGFCRFNGRRAVWYGAEDGRHVVREFRDGVACTNEAFGTDPARREYKRCMIER